MQINPNVSTIKESINAKFIKNISTRNSTESNESIQEGLVNNLNLKKCKNLFNKYLSLYIA